MSDRYIVKETSYSGKPAYYVFDTQANQREPVYTSGRETTFRYKPFAEKLAKDLNDGAIKGKFGNSTAYQNGRAKAQAALRMRAENINLPNTGKYKQIHKSKSGYYVLEGDPYGPDGKYQDWKVGTSLTGTMTVFDSRKAAIDYADKSE